MSAELQLKETIDKLGRTFESFQKDILGRQEKFEKENRRDPIKEDEIAKKVADIINFDEEKERIEKAQEELAAVKTKAEELEARLNEPVMGGGATKGQLPPKVKAALERHFRHPSDAEAVETIHQYAAKHEVKSLNLTDASGGVFYSFTHDNAIEPLIREVAPLRQVCSVRRIGTGSYTFKRQTGHTDAGWVGEVETRSETDAPTFGQNEIVTHECYAQPLISQKMLDDAEVDIEMELNEDLVETFANLENTAFITGNGVTQPRGLLSYTADFSSTEAADKILYIATGASGDWAATDPHIKLLGVGEQLKAQFLANARWMMSRHRLAEVMKFVDGNKLPIWQPSYQAGTPSLLLGFPVTRNEHMPAKAANSYSVVFGDFKQAYRIIDRIGMRVLRDPFTSKGFVKFYTTRRVGGDVVRKDAFLAFKFASS